jgi:PEP-CTERM motif
MLNCPLANFTLRRAEGPLLCKFGYVAMVRLFAHRKKSPLHLRLCALTLVAIGQKCHRQIRMIRENLRSMLPLRFREPLQTIAKFTAAIFTLLIVLGLAGTSAKADFFNFDPDGLNNPNGTGSLPAVTISGFDQAVGNALGANLNTAIPNFLAGGPAAANQFDLYYQATLQGYTGGSPPNPTGLNDNFQLTFSLRVRETITGVTVLPGGSAFTTFAPVTPPGGPTDPNYFLRMYYNGAATTKLGNGNLSGLTFQDGQVILDATPIIKPGDSGNFQVNGNGSGGVLTDTFDKAGTNNYSGTTTVVGNGSQVLDFHINAVDPTFFISGPSAIELHLNSSLVTPFDTVDPSGKFRDKDSAASLGLTVPGTPVSPNIGTINGALPGQGGGTDIQFQADANSSVTVIPEPSSITLVGLGLVGLVGRRRKSKQSVSSRVLG